MNLHIVTVGTSILSNRGWQRGKPLPDKKDLEAAVGKDPRNASAELNALLHYVDDGRCDRVHLIATDTPEGRLCRDIVGGWLASRNIQTEKGAIADLLPPQPGDPYAAAALLRDRIFDVAQSAHDRGDRVYLNLTGGLKSETSIAAATAALLTIAGIPVTAYYAHESMPRPMELPILSLCPDLLGRLRRDFNAGSYVTLRRPLDSELQIAERERLITVQRGTENSPTTAKLTPFGRFLVDRFAPEPHDLIQPDPNAL